MQTSFNVCLNNSALPACPRVELSVSCIESNVPLANGNPFVGRPSVSNIIMLGKFGLSEATIIQNEVKTKQLQEYRLNLENVHACYLEQNIICNFKGTTCICPATFMN
jgi:hypothetical protein